MKARMLILLVAAAGLAIYYALREPPVHEVPIQTAEGKPPDWEHEKPLWTFPLPGDLPDVPPSFDITVEVDTSSGKNRLYFNVTETHGYYVEAPRIRFWYSGGDKYPNFEDSPITRTHYLNRYVKANETLRFCIELVPAELAHVGGDIGATGDWSAIVIHYPPGRYRVANPDPLPRVDESTLCD